MSEFDELMRQKAVALKYDPEKNGAPMIVASGMGYLAEKITETAMEAGVPVYEDNSLATLLTQLKLGAEIPRELYQAIVEIYIYFLGYVPDQKEEAHGDGGGEGAEGSQTDGAAEGGAGPAGSGDRAAADSGDLAGAAAGRNSAGASADGGGATGGRAGAAAGAGGAANGRAGAASGGAAGSRAGSVAGGAAGGRAEAVAGRAGARTTGGPGPVNNMALRGTPAGPTLRESRGRS